MTDSTRQLYGPDGDPCTACGAPLAGDQRYCLSCGARRPEAVLPLDGLTSGGAQLVPYGQPLPAGPVGAAAPAAPTLNDRLRANSPLMGLVGVLLLALLIGVLLGHWAGGEPSAAAATPAPQIISVGGGAAAPAAAPAATPTPTTPTDTSTGSDASGASPSGGSGTTSTSTTPVPAKKAAPAVKKLSNLSGKDYQKAVDKLPKSFSTGGKAPKVDKSKPAGAGSATEDIG